MIVVETAEANSDVAVVVVNIERWVDWGTSGVGGVLVVDTCAVAAVAVVDIDSGSMQKGKSCESINNQDPDLGDSSRFVRRSHVRSTWSPSMRTVRKNEFEINHQQKKHFLQKLFKSPISKQL